MKRWLIVRHVRAISMMATYCYRAIIIWGVDEVKSSGYFAIYRQRARRVWEGRE